MATERRARTAIVRTNERKSAGGGASFRVRPLLLGAALAAAALAPGALAQESVGDPTAKALDRNAATEAFGRADADASGGIDSAEFAEEVRRFYDQDADGTLDSREYEAAIGALDRIAMVERGEDAEAPTPGDDALLSSAEVALGQLDENGDGQLDPAEFGATVFQVVDADASDVLSVAEVDALARWLDAPDLPNTFDLDGDGQVTAEEYTEVMFQGD